MTEFPFWVN